MHQQSVHGHDKQHSSSSSHSQNIPPHHHNTNNYSHHNTQHLTHQQSSNVNSRPIQDKEKLHFQQHHQQHHQYPLSTSSSLLPTSSLRDIVSLVLILLSLPHTVSLCLLVVHILLGSNFTGGKFIIKFLVRDTAEPFFVNARRVALSSAKLVIINSAIFGFLSLLITKKSHFNYLIMFSKAIISSDLIGSSSINYINSISNKRISSKIQYDDDKKYFNNGLVNSVICFFIINYINYLVRWLNGSFDLIDKYSNNLSYINNYNFANYKNKLYLILSVHIISSSIFKKPSTVHNSISNVFEDISINCDENKLLDINLDDSISKSSPLPKNANHIIPQPNSVAIKNFENFIVSPFNSKLTILKNKLRINSHSTISSISSISGSQNTSSQPPSTTTSTTTASTTTSTSTSLTTTTVSPHITTIENTIIIQPFWSILAACKAILKNPNLFLGESTKFKNNGGKFIKMHEENEINSTEKIKEIQMATMLIDDSKVILKFLNEEDVKRLGPNNLKVKLNNVNWSYFKVISINETDVRLIIYGLTPLFQYEIDIIFGGQILNHSIINTTNDNEKLVLNKSLAETSSLQTLQISLVSAIKNLNSLKAKLKKFKREENKKLTETKNNIDNLKGKMSKYSNKLNTDQRAYGKLKGLKHSVIQLENEIDQLTKAIAELKQEEVQIKDDFKSKEQILLSEAGQLESVAAQYEDRMKKERSNLKAIKIEAHSIAAKNQKLLNKQAMRIEEIKGLKNDLKSIKKNEILAKFSKRTKKVNERYDTILPKVIQETELLRDECSEWLNDD